MRKGLWVLLLAGIALAGKPDNWNGYGDTVRVSGMYASQTVYGLPMNLTDYEDMQIVMKVDDTTGTGFAGDSVAFHWGYQSGCVILNSSGAKDTVWQTMDMVVLDTCFVDSFGLMVKGKQAYDGTITKTLKGVDTTSITGWAVQKRWVVPMWDVLIRPWAQGLGGKNIKTNAKCLKLQFDFIRRLGTRIVD